MLASESIAGKSTIHGFPTDHAVIDILLRSGANKDATNRDGLTAYGIFIKLHRQYVESTYAAMGGQIPNLDATAGYDVIREKLMPLNGPTGADLTGGATEDSGLICYDNEDIAVENDMDEDVDEESDEESNH